jgi:DNA-directed RNA polymerase I subunit RPA2
MASQKKSRVAPTNTTWDHEYNTLRREHLFRNPPKDHSAYPALQIAINPHIEAFNALFPDNGQPGLTEHALEEIGTITYLDGDERAAAAGKNKLTIRFKSIELGKSMVPASNKFAKNPEIYPAECRERHVSYRGRLTATLECRINDGDPHVVRRDIGLMPLMVKVSESGGLRWAHSWALLMGLA